MEQKLSIVIINYNEEDNIGRCLDSVKAIANEIIVIDSFSTDRTEEICANYPVKFIKHAFEGHKEQKNFAIQQASADFILSLDADEALSPRLEEQIRTCDFSHDGYKINRLTNYQGAWIKHSGWYPDRKLRLVKKGYAQWSGENPHDRLELLNSQDIGYLKGNLYHYSYKNLTDHAARTNNYSSIAAQEAYKKNNGYSTFKILFSPVFIFVKKFLFQLGFLDGYNGFLIAGMAAYGKFLKYSKLRELYKYQN